ncbi:MAG TPA: hypothetical protein ENI34_10080 [candidate division WOR-3 bacterium]|uniref:Rubrerythrin diiron-binding domain-containing protein n=1 Tax=candidate division WOR-3 bacterium TaxID=2052148 RepID=A0A9C9K0T7_UNCW3|nr:hypothetical protein [candidate division WOR-3 bacterium]
MTVFKAEEVFQFAVRIEENGENFYRKAAEKVPDEKTSTLFKSLADEEVKHKEIFQDMASKIEKYEPFENYPGEYFEYLRAYADNIIFDDKKLAEKINSITGPVDAINFAIDTELASILYYHDIKKLVPAEKHDLIDRIIEEERRHFTRLTKIKESM